jgi:hypothetical protein
MAGRLWLGGTANFTPFCQANNRAIYKEEKELVPKHPFLIFVDLI